MRNRIFGALIFSVGLLVAISPRYILPTCEFAGKPHMVCTNTANAALFAGIFIMSASLGLFFSRSSEVLRYLMLSAFVAGVSVIILPEVFGYCPSPQMPCRYGAVPMIRLLGVLGSLASMAGFAISFKKTAGQV